MELDRIGAIAVRVLATDLSNLTARLAVMTAVIEDLVDKSNGMDPSRWQHEEIDGEHFMKIPAEEMNKIQAVLGLIRSMQ